jgi:hypothetical protein
MMKCGSFYPKGRDETGMDWGKYGQVGENTEARTANTGFDQEVGRSDGQPHDLGAELDGLLCLVAAATNGLS